MIEVEVEVEGLVDVEAVVVAVATTCFVLSFVIYVAEPIQVLQ